MDTVRSGFASNNASLSTAMVESELARSLLRDTPDRNNLSFSNLNGIIANDKTRFPSSFATVATKGDMAQPDLPAKLAKITIVL